MKRIVTVSYQGNCPRCGKEQTNPKPENVDIDCWDCKVNANLERHDIMQDIKKAIQESCFRPAAKMRGFIPVCEFHLKNPEKWGKDGMTFTGSRFVREDTA